MLTGQNLAKTSLFLLALISSALTAGPAEADWRAECQSDPIQDFKYCKVSTIIPRGKPGFELNWMGVAVYEGQEVIMIGDNYFPGSSITIRVDKNPPLKWKVKDRHKPLYEQAIAIEQMMSGTRVLARYTKWPQKTYDTGEFSLIGFAVALRQARQAVKQR